MYVIKHLPTKTLFGICPLSQSRNNICVFPNFQHARHVASNITNFKYSTNRFPTPNYIENLFKHPEDLIYENDYTPFNQSMTMHDYQIEIEPIVEFDLLKCCQIANLNIVFCILNSNKNPDLIYLPLNESEINYQFLDKCLQIS